MFDVPPRRLLTDQLEIAYHDLGPSDGHPVVLMHGFPYDVLAYEAVAQGLAAEGMRAIVPHLRGYGSTRFRGPEVVRSGQQAALGNDLLQLIDRLDLDRPILVGFDWGGRAACIVAALWPERVRGLVTVGGYNMYGPVTRAPRDPATEHQAWYHFYLCLDRGRTMLKERRREFCRYLWRDWSPGWTFDEATFEASAASFDNPDFVDVVVHSYRHRHGEAPGDPALAALQELTETLPPITVPTVVLHGADDFYPIAKSRDRGRFTGPYEYRLLEGAGHNPPQEAPEAMLDAIVALARRTELGDGR